MNIPNTCGYQRVCLLLGTGLLLTMAGCYVEPSGGYARGGPSPQVIVEDDYVYYPDYECYYAPNRREFYYLEGRSWVTRPAPRGVSIDVLLSSPSVRMSFHDSPERHHAEIVREYPRHWTSQGSVSVQTRQQDHYVYYPGNEIYYNTTQRQYVYREGNSWVTRPEPPRAAAKVLPKAPSVEVPFHDAPAQHHTEIVKTYPKNWKPAPPKRQDDKDDHRDDHKDDRRGDHKDDHNDDHKDDQRKQN